MPVVVSRNVKFLKLGGSICCIQKRGMVFLGFGDPGIADRVNERMVFQNEGELIFEGKGYFSPGCKIVNTGLIRFGKDFDMKARSTIISDKSVEFGNHVLISWDCLIMDTDMHIINNNEGNRTNISESVLIEMMFG